MTSLLATVLAAAIVSEPSFAQGQPPLPTPVKVERRLLVKERRLIVTAGAGWFERGDYYDSPGLALSAAYYPDEANGAELRLGWFFSSLNSAASEVFERTGLLPDSQRALGLVLAGYRRSLAYGKVLAGGTEGLLLHFELHASVLGGVQLTDRAVNPALMACPALLVRLSPRAFLSLDPGLVLSLEQRRRWTVSLGALPTVTAGAALW